MNSLLNEIASYLDDEGVGSFDGTDAARTIFVGDHPPSPDSCVTLLGRPGATLGDQRTIQSLHFPYFTALIRNPDYDDGADKAEAVRTALHGLVNEQLPHWRVLRCYAATETEPIGKDAQGRYGFTIEFSVEANAQNA